ncbi:protein delta homolog 2 isoform X4 [Fundulus heteroclitus]|uniref:protein delta homolog 2 isoform X4 n=1 Tax=Fundulus heteroclitus TaxID=8078 RepID=UPI00165C87D2|nr:protein delta homolog 2 isoform X4 [Fundulus heteroclitus]
MMEEVRCDSPPLHQTPVAFPPAHSPILLCAEQTGGGGGGGGGGVCGMRATRTPAVIQACRFLSLQSQLFPGIPACLPDSRRRGLRGGGGGGAGRRLAAVDMAAVRAAAGLLLLSCCRLAILAPPCAGKGSDCSCNLTNSRCDEFGVCRCDPGWEGELCERCVTMPGCVYGSCLQPWQCTCEAGWGGRFCDKDLSVCSQTQPCHNGATCLLEDSGDFRCLCPHGFHGPACEKRMGPCHQRRSPCKNGGLCEDADGFAAELACRCLAGFTGSRCETDIDDCLMGPCASGATCVDGLNRFSCLCPAGFTGRFCTVNTDDCISQPCLNGGRCLDRAGGFSCLCQAGFSGTTCETARPPNASRPVWTTPGWDSGRPDSRKVKVTVKERGAAGLSDLQLIIVLVLTGVTLGAVALTAALVLRGRCRARGQPACCSSPPPEAGSRSRQEHGDAAEHRISFLNVTEPQKKKLNTEVI